MKKLYVGNLPFSANENDLQGLFSQFGQVDSINIVRDRDSGQPRGFAFVEMSDDQSAENAINGTNGSDFGGRNLMVNEARPQTPRAGGGGGGGYRGGGGGYRGGGGSSRGGNGGRGGGGGRDRGGRGGYGR